MTIETEEVCLSGVTPDVSAKKRACSADTVDTDGMLFRTCEHGVKHPVGHLSRDLSFTEHFDDGKRHYMTTDYFAAKRIVACDSCCDYTAWRSE